MGDSETTRETRKDILNGREHFNFYRNYGNVFFKLPGEDCKELLKAVYNYNFYEELPDFSDNLVLEIAFAAIQGGIDAAIKRYVKQVTANRENGGKGGRPKEKAETQQNPTKPNKTQWVFQEPNETQQNPMGFSETQRNPTEPIKGNQNPEDRIGEDRIGEDIYSDLVFDNIKSNTGSRGKNIMNSINQLAESKSISTGAKRELPVNDPDDLQRQLEAVSGER